jgi:hypothetical protein
MKGDKSAIEWTDATWNPTTGCTEISAGCDHCYAETLSLRLQKMGVAKYKDGFAVRLHRIKDTPYTPDGTSHAPKADGAGAHRARPELSSCAWSYSRAYPANWRRAGKS